MTVAAVERGRRRASVSPSFHSWPRSLVRSRMVLITNAPMGGVTGLRCVAQLMTQRIFDAHLRNSIVTLFRPRSQPESVRKWHSKGH